jgi:hypothetical protein
VASTILIAASDQLAALQQHPDLTDADAFADTDALKALEAIARTRPQVIALDKRFAASARGAALINRIKAEPSLSTCEIRILEAGARPAPPAAPPAAPASDAPLPDAPIETPVDAVPAVVPAMRDTRRAERFVIKGNVEVQIDGNPATLVNISVVGAQITSPMALRPNQRVRMSLLESARPIRFNGVVAWATFEMPKEGPRYRAGINFYDAAPDAVTRFIETITQRP